MPKRAKHTHLCPIVTADPKAVDQDGACPPGGSRVGPPTCISFKLLELVSDFYACHYEIQQQQPQHTFVCKEKVLYHTHRLEMRQPFQTRLELLI